MQTPGQVQLTFDLAGFGSVRVENVVVRAGTTTTSSVTMKLAAQQENVTVIGAAPVVDRASSQVAVNFSSEMLQSLPNARDIWVVLALRRLGARVIPERQPLSRVARSGCPGR